MPVVANLFTAALSPTLPLVSGLRKSALPSLRTRATIGALSAGSREGVSLNSVFDADRPSYACNNVFENEQILEHRQMSDFGHEGNSSTLDNSVHWAPIYDHF